MRKMLTVFKNIKNDESGAALIEYTALLAILLVAVIAIITGVGKYISSVWNGLNTALS